MVDRNLNSYTLEKLDGTPITGLFSARRLREFIPKEGMKLARDQAEFLQQLDPQDVGEQSGDEENRRGNENTGQLLGDEDATTEEGGTTTFRSLDATFP